MSAKLEFDPNLDYQLDAIKAVTDLLEGQPLEEAAIEYQLGQELGELNLINGVGNNLIISPEQLLANLQTVQKRNEISPSSALDGNHFSIEMETGTGKSYVYLRTIYELYLQCGFKKFIIVVLTRGRPRRTC
jgi:type III restriction enzyme